MVSRENGTRSGIYIIRHLWSGKAYVGQASNIWNRWSVHRYHLRAGTHHCSYLQRIWNKYGEQEFEFRIMQFGTVESLDHLERRWCNKFYGLLLNTRPAGKTARGYTLSISARKKISEAQLRIGADPEERKRRSERAKKQHQEGRIGKCELVRPVRHCNKCGVEFNRYKTTSGKYHNTNRCLTCMAEHYAHTGGRFNIHQFDLSIDEFDDAAYELTWCRIYDKQEYKRTTRRKRRLERTLFDGRRPKQRYPGVA